jgi:Flp pilus assembly protein TadG
MREFLQLLGRFRRDERGVFAVFFGLIAIVLVATAGAVVDFTSLQQARTRAQDALDSAALGLQPTIWTAGVTEATIEVKAQALLEERLANETIAADITDVAINTTDGELRLEAELIVPTYFVALVGVTEIRAGIASKATRKRLNIEVAMVLDNSGSMNQLNRMPNLKAAAHCAKNILFNSDCNSTATTAAVDTVKIGIVPFTSFVNVGTGYANAVWMDTAGTSEIANDNFDNDHNDASAYTGPVNRFALFNALSNVSWQGCVESRKYPYDTNDVFDASVPNTLFVPEFAPDEPDSGFGNSYLSDTPAVCKAAPRYVQTTIRTLCNDSINGSGTNSNNRDWNNMTCIGTTTNTYKTISPTGVELPATSTRPASLSTDPGSNLDPGDNAYSTNYSTITVGTGTYRYTVTRTRTWTYVYSNRELQERLCKYTGSITTSGGRGPNQDCPTNPMTPLTNTKATITAAINAMYPQGFTNIHQGAIWGFHMLTPTEPLTEARPYTSATYKVMIVMTDGENTYDGWNTSNMNGGAGFWAYGYPWNNPSASYVWPSTSKRMASAAYPNPSSYAQLIAAQNSRTVETCTNAKAAGITIYTIGLNSPNQTTTDMLRACATSTGHAYFPTASSQLIDVFTEIAGQLSNLRLAE